MGKASKAPVTAMLSSLCRSCMRPARPMPLTLFQRAASSAPIRNVDSFAVVQIKGKQYKVAKDDVLIAEKLDAEVGSQVVFTDVLLAGKADGTTLIGRPILAGASVSMTVQEQTESAKVDVFKKKRRKNYRRWNAHKQPITVLAVDEIQFPSA